MTKARAPRTVKKRSPKECAHCQGEMDNWRRTYHPECLPAAKEAANLARRRCSRCRTVKAASRFASDPTRGDGKFPWCMDCTKEANHEARFQNPDDVENGHVCPVCDTLIRGHLNRRYCSTRCKDKAAALRKKFNLTVEQYRRMIADAAGRCPLCDSRVKLWAVDHDHRTRRVTGVVCTPCNVQLLAASRHDIDRVERLLAYLKYTPADRLGIEVLVPEEMNRPSNIHKIWAHGRQRPVVTNP